MQSCRPSTPFLQGFSKDLCWLPRQDLSLVPKLIAGSIIRVTRPGPWRRGSMLVTSLVPRVTGHTFPFLNAHSTSGTLHTWYLFNSHRGHTKKLLLLIHETETSGSGTCPESDTFTAVGPAFELGPCQYAAHVCAGPGIGEAPGPGVLGWPGVGGRRCFPGDRGSPLPRERAAASGLAVPVTRPSPVQAFIPSTISVITPFPHLSSSSFEAPSSTTKQISTSAGY